MAIKIALRESYFSIIINQLKQEPQLVKMALIKMTIEIKIDWTNERLAHLQGIINGSLREPNLALRGPEQFNVPPKPGDTYKNQEILKMLEDKEDNLWLIKCISEEAYKEYALSSSTKSQCNHELGVAQGGYAEDAGIYGWDLD